MSSNESNASDSFFKLWIWIEDNLKQIVIAAGIFAVVLFGFSYYNYHLKQNEITAGQALTKLILVGGSQSADGFLKIAAEYPGTLTSQRALLQGATTLFTNGKFAEAQTQFQKFLDTYPDNDFAPQALLGVAASLDAQDKTDLAMGAYQKAAGQITSSSVAASAKFAMARIYDTQGKTADAARLYEDVARSNPNSSMGSEAGLRAMELKSTLPATAVKTVTTPAAAPVSPFTLSK